MDREHLHGGGVGLEAAAAVLVEHVVAGLADAGPQPRGEGGDAEPLGRRLVVEQLADVAEIGERRARRRRRDRTRAGRRSCVVIASSSEATPGCAGSPPTRGGGCRPSPTPRRRRSRPARPTSRRTSSSAAAWTRVTDDGRSSASSSASHSSATGVPKTLPAPAITAGTPTGVERVAHERAVRGGWRPARRCRRADGLGADLGAVGPGGDQLGAGRQQRDDVGGEVAGHLARPGGDTRPALAASARRDRRRGATTRTRSAAPCGRAAQPGSLVGIGGLHGAVLDARVAERERRRTARRRPRRGPWSLRQLRARVATVSAGGRLRGRCARRRRGRRRSPAWDRRSARASCVPSPNAVRTMSHCTGSVSWNSSTITTSKRSRSRSAAVPDRAARACSRVEQVVVGEDARSAACAARPRRARRRASRTRIAASGSVGVRRARSPPTAGATTARPMLAGHGERQSSLGGACVDERAQVEVVDHLVDEVGEVLDERDVPVDVAGDADAAQDLLAEPVRGGDRRGVEVGQRRGDPSRVAGPARRPARRRAGRAPRRRPPGRTPCDGGQQPGLDADEPLADPRRAARRSPSARTSRAASASSGVPSAT